MKLTAAILFVLLFAFEKPNTISVLTYNVNYSFINKKVVTILDTINADVVCLQETNAKWEEILRGGLQDKYPYIEFKHRGSSGGLAILSKYPILKINYLRNKPGWFPAAEITIKKGQDTIQLLNVHLKPGLTKKGRIGWNAYFKAEDVHVEELTQFMDSLKPNLPTIILGDFNENDNGKAMQWLQNEMSFQDALPHFDKRSKTWRWIILRGRYDHLVFNKQLSCTTAKVYKLGKSDHFPVFGVFEIKK
ncbi:MAG: endonuclease/exonuclease/phosphatase family protein [Flavobacteriales bacterium]|nr:endonuclease/exonuclease/phosphatase family protein [Flavobacteriales bacterium]